MSFPIEAAAARAGFASGCRSCKSLLSTAIQARPAYKRALEKGGPYTLLK